MLLSTKLYLDGGDPEETREADAILRRAGFKGLEGQTTNPSLIVKHAKNARGTDREKLTEEEALLFYKKTVIEIARYTSGPVSIQVTGDPKTLTADTMLTQARDRNLWTDKAMIKFPCTFEGLNAAGVFCQEGRVNITLVFSQEQAAAVYAATRHATHEVCVSPFVGRLDDRGEKGMDIVANTLQMYRGLGDSHVRTLTASVRNLDHLMYALALKSDIVSIPFSVLNEWQEKGFVLPDDTYVYDTPGLAEIPYRELNLESSWSEFDLSHDLTEQGLARFWDDWSGIVG